MQAYNPLFTVEYYLKQIELTSSCFLSSAFVADAAFLLTEESAKMSSSSAAVLLCFAVQKQKYKTVIALLNGLQGAKLKS